MHILEPKKRRKYTKNVGVNRSECVDELSHNVSTSCLTIHGRVVSKNVLTSCLVPHKKHLSYSRLMASFDEQAP